MLQYAWSISALKGQTLMEIVALDLLFLASDACLQPHNNAHMLIS